MPVQKTSRSAPKALVKRHASPKTNTRLVKRAKNAAADLRVRLNEKPTGRLRIYVFGGNSGGELGIGAKSSDSVYKPTWNAKLDEAKVVQVATGGMHGVALTIDNKIVTWGVNDHGALGRDTSWEGGMVDIKDDAGDLDAEGDLNPREASTREIDMTQVLEGNVFTQVAASDNASFAVTEAGLLYAWGTFRVSVIRW